MRPDGTYDPDLAESVEIINPTTITVHMRSGMQFSDATPLDAQAAVNSIQRTIAGKPRGLRTAELGTISAITVDNPTQFTVKLSVPQAGLIFPLFADAEMSPVSPKTIAIPGDHSRDVVMAGPLGPCAHRLHLGEALREPALHARPGQLDRAGPDSNLLKRQREEVALSDEGVTPPGWIRVRFA